MLGKPSRRERKNLEQNGKHAQAVVVEISERGMAITNGADTIVANTEVMLKTKLRVEPDGEPAFEVQQRFRYPQLAVPSAGMRLNVLYDPDDHDHIMIDRSASGVKVGNTDMASLLKTVQDNQANPSSDPMAFANAVMGQMGIQGARGGTVIIDGQQIGGTPGTAMPGMPSSAAAAEDPVDKLEKLARLRDSGVLTEAEFQTQKARILGESV
jgi:Short C-terminal domain